jgi:hypothetical protein
VPSDQEVEKMEEAVRGLATLRPKDITEAVLFLASNDSRCISGHNLEKPHRAVNERGRLSTLLDGGAVIRRKTLFIQGVPLYSKFISFG